MMKKLLLLLFISVTSLMVISQTYTVSVSGYVEDIDSGEPIANHMVQLFTDSIPDDFFYYNTVWTDESGLFEDSFDVPSGVSGDLIVSTPGCQGAWLTEEVFYSENNTDFTFSFLTCSDPNGGGEDCEAMFYYYPVGDLTSTIQFIDISTGYPDSWYWEFGDGASSTEQDPIHTYDDEGEYYVNLTISSDSLDCTSTLEMLIRVADSNWFPDSCMAMFYTYPNQEDFLTVNFVDMSIGNGNEPPDNWFWSFGDGNSSSEQNPVHTYGSEGMYEVCLTISTDDSSCINTYCEYVEVIDWNNQCQAQFYYYPRNDSFPSDGMAVQFIDYSYGNPTSWDWDFGDGTLSTEQHPLHIYVDTGTYEVCLSIANPEDSCYSTICQDVYVFDDTLTDCYAWFEYSISELTVDFTGWSMSNQQDYFSWDFGDGTTGSGQTISHTYSEDGIYTVIMSFSDSVNNCYTTYSEIVWVGEDFSFEVFGYVFVDDSMTADLADVFLMTFDTIDGELVNVAETEIDEYGYYEFEEVSAEHCVYFIQAELQQASVDYGNYVPTYHYDALTWQQAWPIFPYPSGMSYNVMMIPSDAPEAGSGQITGIVTNDVNRDLLENVEIVLMNANGDPIAYTRTDENGYFSFSDLAYGTYMIHVEIPGVESNPVTVNLNEDNSSENLNIIVKDGEAILGLKEPVSEYIQQVSNVFPNPASESASVEVELKKATRLTALVRSSLGNTIIHREAFYSTGIHQLSFDLEGLPKGLYFIDIQSDDGTRVVKKLVKL